MLDIRDLKTPLIGPINLDIAPGTCSTVSGPSGAGKSLLLRTIADLDESTGQVTLNGLSRDDLTAPDWRRKVAYVPAESGWWAERVEDHFDKPDGLAERLAAVGLGEALPWEISRLSTGERQRLALVRALENEPEVLLLDEPTSALDPPSVAQVEDLLRERLQTGCAVLIVTHDPDQPKRLGAREFQMTSGRLTALTPREATP